MKKFDHIYQDAELIKKYLLGEANETEQQALEDQLAASPALRQAVEELQDKGKVKEEFDNYTIYSSKKAYDDFLNKTKPAPVLTPQRRHKQLAWFSAAAIAVLTIGLSYFLFQQNEVIETVESSAIQPGTQFAKLTFPDGSQIDMKQKDMEVTVDGVKVKYQNGVISYLPTATPTPEAETDKPVPSNKLVTPRGAENTVILSDGTTVHLNAGSRLTYPVRFRGKRRLVLLEGEAYFEVKADAEHPFVVRTHVGDVTVLGTSFNVNAYTDSPVCYTTLVQGKVQVTSNKKEALVLAPGEQAVFSDRSTTKREVDVEEYVSWVNGVYVFHDRTLGEMMQTFKRWYNFEVRYEKPELKNLTYSGNLKRDAHITSFLDALEMTGDLQYEIHDKNIIYIRPGKN